VNAPQGVLIILNVTDRPIGGMGSLIEVLLILPRKDPIPDLQTEYDLDSLGEVESIHGPCCDPPRWMVSYKEEVLAKKGDRIKRKDSISGSRLFVSDPSRPPVKQTP
jgi:hypothetical protein